MIEKVEMNLDEEFPHLQGAPIVEAAISWDAVAAESFDPKTLHDFLRDRLPEYPQVTPQVEFSLKHHVEPDGSRTAHSHAWQAFQIAMNGEPYVAQFRRTGLVVSRLKPYESWTPFREEAIRLWGIYEEFASPPEIQKIGLRYINLVPVASVSDASRYLRQPPKFPGTPIGGGNGLPMSNFVHQARFDVPGHDLQLNLVHTVQAAPPGSGKELNLIVDFDIFSTGNRVEIDDFQSGQIFQMMRWVKNKAFFSVFSEHAISQFRG